MALFPAPHHHSLDQTKAPYPSNINIAQFSSFSIICSYPTHVALLPSACLALSPLQPRTYSASTRVQPPSKRTTSPLALSICFTPEQPLPSYSVSFCPQEPGITNNPLRPAFLFFTLSYFHNKKKRAKTWSICF
jgi:hypothetical protein